MRRHWMLHGLKFALFAAVFLAAVSFVVMTLWNWLWLLGSGGAPRPGQDPLRRFPRPRGAALALAPSHARALGADDA